MTDRSRFTITPIGSLHTGWALKVDGILRRSSPSLISLGAYVDAIMAGADEADADNIARPLLVHGVRLGPSREVGSEDRGALPMISRAALL